MPQCNMIADREVGMSDRVNRILDRNGKSHKGELVAKARLPEMKEYDVVLASGAEHLKARFERHGYRVYISDTNYDEKRFFPNADIYARIAEVKELSDRKVLVVQSCTGSGPVETEFFTTSDRVVELLLLLDILKSPVEVVKVGHKEYEETPVVPPAKVEVLLTFQPFALQDKSFETGEAASGHWAMDQIARSCNKVWAINPHITEDLKWVKDLEDRGLFEHIDVTGDLVRFGAKAFGFDDYKVVAPDEGAQERYDVNGYGKTREDSYTIELRGELAVEGKNVIVLDDLTKSGSTLLKTARRLYDQGAKDVGMAVVHVLPLMKRGEELLENLFEKSNGKIVTSNTVKTKIFCEENPNLSYNVVDTIARKFS
ncbi:hypothetical protein EU545_05720 [Candidatus Thorarchaeota archaeon]|nr:MAG: hypothetical protein EU545_05720 [Candidatus Thorarchaeota archaeon]